MLPMVEDLDLHLLVVCSLQLGRPGGAPVASPPSRPSPPRRVDAAQCLARWPGQAMHANLSPLANGKLPTPSFKP